MADTEDPGGDQEPESRGPFLPREPTTAEVTRAANAKKVGPTGTIRIHASAIPAAMQARAKDREGGSMIPDRPSRLYTMRQTLLSVLPPIPKSLAAAAGPIAVLGCVLVLMVGALYWMAATGRLPEGLARQLPFRDPPAETPDLFPAPLPPNVEIADDLVEEPSAAPGRANIGRAVLSIPKTFQAFEGGAFDLVVHFHGNTDLVLESYEVALLDTVVVVVNLGNGSGVYEDTYASPAALDRILTRVPEILKKRGLADAHIRRVALVAWSAGYGAVTKALLHAPHAELVDSVVLLDGLHTSFLPGTQRPDLERISSVVKFAERAKRGERLLVITHSRIDPGDYLGVAQTVDAMLGHLNVSRHEETALTTIPPLKAAKGVMPKAELRPLELTTEAREGSLVIRGFKGNEKAHHMGHLMQMSDIALPELAKRWAAKQR